MIQENTELKLQPDAKFKGGGYNVSASPCQAGQDTEGIKKFILQELKNPKYDGYRFPRQNYFLGKWFKHGGWYPDHVLRFFRKDKADIARRLEYALLQISYIICVFFDTKGQS